MISRWILAAAALAIAGGTAQAGSLVVGERLEINVDPKNVEGEAAEVWKNFGDFCAIKDWHPAVAECEETKEGDDTFRTLTLGDGGKIKEKLTETAKRSYKYQIIEGPLPVKNYEAQFAVTPDDDDLDEINLVWAATFDPDGKTAKEARDVITGIFKDGIASIKSKLKPGAVEDDKDEN